MSSRGWRPAALAWTALARDPAVDLHRGPLPTPFYLWHYPVLILVWQASRHALPVGFNLALLAGALLLSDLTFDLYENPLRFARFLSGCVPCDGGGLDVRGRSSRC